MTLDPIPLSCLKPPLGVIPKKLWIEKIEEDRRIQLREAINRYLISGHVIPVEWIEELNELIKK